MVPGPFRPTASQILHLGPVIAQYGIPSTASRHGPAASPSCRSRPGVTTHAKVSPSCAENRTPDFGTPARIISPSGRRPAQGKQTCFRPSCKRVHHTHHPIPRRNSTLAAGRWPLAHGPSSVLLRACPRPHCRCNRLRPPARGSSGRTGPGEAGSVFREMRPIWMMRFQRSSACGFFSATKVSSLFLDKPSDPRPPPDETDVADEVAARQAYRSSSEERPRSKGEQKFSAIFSVTPCSCICHGILLAYQIPHRALSGVAAARLQGSAQGIPSPKHARQNHGPANNTEKSCLVVLLVLGTALPPTRLVWQ